VANKQEPEKAAVAAQLKPKLDPVSGPIESMDDDGDLILVVGPTKVNFRVCSHSLRRSSTPWRTRLSEPKAGDGVHDWVIRLTRTDPDAFRIILRAVHGGLLVFDMPKMLSREALFQVILLCERFDMLGVLKQYWIGWLRNLPKPTLEPTTFVQQVWIAHKLGHLQSYKNILVEFLYSAQKRPGHDDQKVFLDGHPDFDLYKDPYLRELGVLGKLPRLLRRTLSDLYPRALGAWSHGNDPRRDLDSPKRPGQPLDPEDHDVRGPRVQQPRLAADL
jgi:hypothetical protein